MPVNVLFFLPSEENVACFDLGFGHLACEDMVMIFDALGLFRFMNMTSVCARPIWQQACCKLCSRKYFIYFTAAG